MANMRPDEVVGRHLILDVQTSTLRGLNDPQNVYDLLEDLSKRLDMTLVYPPIVARFPFAQTELERFVRGLVDDGVDAPTLGRMRGLLEARRTSMAGVSGVSVWLESHTSIHTWTESNFFSFDAYSCKDFEPKAALAHLLERFDVKSYNGLDIIRTVGTPQKVDRLFWDRDET